MDNHEFSQEDLHLDLRRKSKRKKKFINSSPFSGVRKIYGGQAKPETDIIRIFLFTWNTNSRAAPTNLAIAFPIEADIYAIGLQEVGSFDWVTTFDHLFRSLNVVRLKVRRMQGILSIVYVRRHLLQYVCRIESETTKTGLAGMWGNKGGVSIRFDLLGINIVIINSHLAAHMEKVMERLDDINNILESQKFKDPDVNNILDHDYVFWMGDLNFRVDDTSYELALQHILQKKYQQLLNNDQLRTVMLEEMAFIGFKEDEITFPPTYKFDVGTDTYDTSAKKRIPAYCDRILHYNHQTNYAKNDLLSIKPIEYQSHPMYTVSDHKPVTCTADITALSQPPPNPVVFKRSKGASLMVPFVVRYSFKNKAHPLPGDWIGLYRTDFMHFDDYVGYMWVKPQSENSRSSRAQSHFAVFPVAILKKLGTARHFMVCYISKQYHFSGISDIMELSN